MVLNETGAAYSVDGVKLLKVGYGTVMPNGCNRRRWLNVITKYDGVVCKADPLHVYYALCINKNPSSTVKAMKNTKTENNSDGNVGRKVKITEIVQKVLRYQKSFEKSSAAYVTDVRRL